MSSSLLREGLIEAGRLLTRWRRDRAVLMGSLLLPVALLLLYVLVLGDRVRAITGAHSVYGLVPTCLVLSALFGTLGNAVSLTMDRESGLLTKMWLLPVHRACAITGRLIAEATRALIGSILIAALGMVLGLRFAHGWAAAVLYLLIPSVVAIGFTALVAALVLSSRGRAYTTWLVGGVVAMAFINPGITPIGLFPDWMQPFVRFQPMSPPIEAMRGLAYGGPLAWPLAMTFIWAISLLIVFLPLAVRSYGRAAESHG
ncbi:ABC transporter permease [Mycolicibacterium novocastrense]|uniref:ABC transporter permease n=1 Tax=Mycolicibacterium novocastrense TaxID=59813 RepID=UPI002E26363B|nr:ABC transporter permease [Mycolicibacterium novocastrense]